MRLGPEAPGGYRRLEGRDGKQERNETERREGWAR